MNILYIGAGYVGTCSAAVSANSGHHTLVYDIDEAKVKKLGSNDRDIIESSLFEEGLGDLLLRGGDRVRFTSDYGDVERFLDTCQAVFMCLPTPEIGETGESDLRYYTAAAERLAQALALRNSGAQSTYIVLVNKSTVPIDMVARAEDLFTQAGVRNIGVVSNPEFLVEGKAVAGSLKPDRVVVGAWAEKDFLVMRDIYQRFYDSPTTQYIEVNPKEAAAGKLLANFYLFNRLAVCFDVIGRTCETFADIKFEQIRRILTTDSRIGNWGFYDSLYAGGSCLTKDARSLSHQLQTAGAQAVLVNETHLANTRQLEIFLGRATREAGMTWAGRSVAVLGLTFKRDTNDTRNAPSVQIVEFLRSEGAGSIRLYDPEAMTQFQSLFPPSDIISYVEHEFTAIKDAEIVIIAADWPQFRGLGDVIVGAMKKKLLIMDGRRMLQHRYADLQEAGMDIIAVGSPFLPGKKM